MLNLWYRFQSLILSFVLTLLYILVSIYDRGYLNFDLWDKNVTNVSFFLFFLLLFVLNLNLRPNKLNDEEILEVQNTKKQQNLLEQLNQARSMKNNIEISLKKMLTKEKDLNRTKKSIYEKMQKAKDNLSKDMRLNRKAIVEYYNKKLERLEEEINNLAPEIEKKKTRLDVVQNKIQLIERENNKIAS